MQPDDFAAERDGFVEQRLVRSQRDTQARPHEIVAKASGEGRMRHHRGEIRDHVVWRDRRAVRLGQRLQDSRAHIRLRRLLVRPERIYATAATVVVM